MRWAMLLPMTLLPPNQSGFTLIGISDPLSGGEEGVALDELRRQRIERLIGRIQDLRAQLASECAALEHELAEVGGDDAVEMVPHD